MTEKAGRPRRRGGARSRRSARGRWVWLIVGVVILMGVALAIASVASRSETAGTSKAASDALVRQVTSVPAATTAAVGAGSATKQPKRIDGDALMTEGKPRVLYIGAEYCPYCAAERWALIQALARFGDFTGLRTTTSSSTDAFPSTPTFSFHGSTYASPYVAFESVELRGNELVGGEYPELETPTAEQSHILETYDAPPYVAPASSGAIPFIDFGGRYMLSGAGYSPDLLAGKTHRRIAAALRDADDPLARAVLGAANGMTAAICNLTAQRPKDVCHTSTISDIQSSIS